MTKGYSALLRNKNFIYLWVSQIFSQVTINLMNFLLLARLYIVTESTIATSMLWVAFCLPTLFIGPIGAATVDMTSRRKVLMLTNLLQALTILGFIFLSQHSVFILYAVVLIYSTLNQFYVPAEAAYLPSTSSKANLPQANSLFFMTIQAAVILGFGFAGIVQRLVGFTGALIISSSFLFLAFVSTTLLPDVKPKNHIPDKFEKALRTFFGSLIEGYEFIKSHKEVLYPLLLLLSIQAGLAIVIVSLPVIGVQILNMPVSLSGIYVVVPAGIGAVLGSVYIPRIMNRGIRKLRIIKTSLGIIGFGLIGLAVGIPLLPVVLRIIIAGILIAVIGLSYTGVYLPTLTFLQSTTPLWLRGRVFGNLSFLLTLVTIFPVIFSGAITEIFGIRTVVTILGMASLGLLTYSVRRGNVLIQENF